MAERDEHEPIDIRMYIGMVFFRWKFIVAAVLWAILIGVVYIQLIPARFNTFCDIMIYQDPSLVIAEDESPVRTMSSRFYLLQSGALREQVAKRLEDKWSSVIKDPAERTPGIYVNRVSGMGPTWRVGLHSEYWEYAEVYLRALVSAHEAEWASFRGESLNTVTRMLEDELADLAQKIRRSEDEVVEYEQMHDIARSEVRRSAESGFLVGLASRRVQLNSQILMLESQFPALKGQPVEVIADAARMTQQSVRIRRAARQASDSRSGADAARPASVPKDSAVAADEADEPDAGLEPLTTPEREQGWQEVRLKIQALEQEEKGLLENLMPDNPRVVAVRGQIQKLRGQLDFEAELMLQKLKDHYEGLKMQVKAVEEAEQKWQVKDSLVARRKSELARIQSGVARYNANYQTVYQRLHDARINEEFKGEHYRVTNPVRTVPKPVWPDAGKILFSSLMAGLAVGFGLAVGMQFVDNRVQTVKDVEKDLGVPFLGGIPLWVHSGLERTVRPIVTEEQSAGAVEAYRALRTSVLTAMNKANEKIVMITSADSREGKTLTSLNLSIMIAQMGKKVLLVDMDLRRGRLHRSLGLAKEPGVTDALNGAFPLRDVVLKTKIANLDLAPAGSAVENASELLQTTSLDAVFRDIRNDYDYIVIDTSPVLRVTDTVIMAAQGLGVLMYLVRINHIPKPMVKYSLDMLNEARIIGVVLNSIEMHRLGSFYYAYQYPNYAYYSNAYSYGYDQYDYGDGPKQKRIRRPQHYRTQSSGVTKWFNRLFLPFR